MAVKEISIARPDVSTSIFSSYKQLFPLLCAQGVITVSMESFSINAILGTPTRKRQDTNAVLQESNYGDDPGIQREIKGLWYFDIAWNIMPDRQANEGS